MAEPLTQAEPDSQFTQIWDNAVQKFFLATNKRLDDSVVSRATSLESLKLLLDNQQQRFSAYRTKRQKLFDAMAKVLRPIELLSNIAAGSTFTGLSPASVVFNAVAYMIATARNVAESYDSICDLFDRLEDFTIRLTVHTRRSISLELRGVITGILCSLIKICGHAARLIKTGRVGEYFKRFLFGKDDEFAHELDSFARLTESEARLVGALTLSVAMETYESVESLQDRMALMMMKVNELQAQDGGTGGQGNLDKIRQVLSPSTAPEEIYRSITSKRVPGTGDWLYEEQLFKAWVSRDLPILWISGGPGQGKTYLSSNIISFLSRLHPQGVHDPSRISVAYWFCKEYDPDLRSFNTALKTVAWQICQNDAVFAKYVSNVCKFPEDIKTTGSLWQKLFVEFFKHDKPGSLVYILLDGVDEAAKEERTSFLELLKDLQTSANGEDRLRVQIVMLGRPELNYDFDQILDVKVPMVTISAQKNGADIGQYVEARIAKEKNLRRISNDLRKEIVSVLTRKADGMFLWVDLMLKEVAAKHREAQMRQVLDGAPQGVYEAIRHTLERFSHELSDEDASDLNTLLSWVACAKEPLSLGSLEIVMKLTSPDGEGVIYLEGQLRKRYASFFSLDREDGRTTEDLLMERSVDMVEGDDLKLDSDFVDHDTGAEGDFGEEMDIESNRTTTEVTLAHASFSSFFHHNTPTCKVGVNINASEVSITKTLLKVISDAQTWQKWRSEDISTYAAVYWQDHLGSINLEKVDERDRDEICQLVISIIRGESMLNWAGRSDSLREDWCFKQSNLSTVKNWLKSGRILESDRAWVESLYPNSSAEILDELVSKMVTQWLEETTWPYPAQVFKFIASYRRMVSSNSFGIVFVTSYSWMRTKENPTTESSNSGGSVIGVKPGETAWLLILSSCIKRHTPAFSDETRMHVHPLFPDY